MQESLLAAVLGNTFSITDLYRRADILQRFFEHFFFEPPAQEGERSALMRSYYGESDTETQSHAGAVAAWGANVLDQYSASDLYERIRALKEVTQSLPKLTLYVPVNLSPAQVERIGTWCRANVQPNIMLDLRVDPAAVGGCAFAYNNAFHDVSLSYFVKKERANLINLLHTYGT